MNETFEKFGWPRTRIFELDHWAAMVRPAQPVLGSLVLACKQPVFALSAVDQAGFSELKQATNLIETLLKQFVHFEKINYLMLMMVDRDVHFHVLPRYEGTREWDGLTLSDKGWPGPPELAGALVLNEGQQEKLAGTLRSHLKRKPFNR